MATSLVFSLSSFWYSSRRIWPSSSTGMTRILAPFSAASCCQGDDVGVVFQDGDHDFIAGADVLAPPALGHQVDGFGGAPHENDFVGGAGADEARHLVPRRLVGIRGPCRQFVGGAVDVGVFVGVEPGQPVDHRLGLVGGGATNGIASSSLRFGGSAGEANAARRSTPIRFGRGSFSPKFAPHGRRPNVGKCRVARFREPPKPRVRCGY